AHERSRARKVSRHSYHRRRVHFLARSLPPHLSRRSRLQLQMEHGLDERHAKILFPRPRSSQVRAQQTHFLAPLCFHGKFLASLFPRRSRPRQKLASPQNARRHVATIRQSRSEEHTSEL